MEKLKKVLIIGRGAVGLVFGDLFADALPEGDFAFLVDEERRKRYETTPLFINGKESHLPLISAKNPFVETEAGEKVPFGQADLILIATKAGGLDGAMQIAEDFCTDQTIFMSCINGILSEDELKEHFPQNRFIRTIAQKMDAVFEQGEERFSTRGELVFGAETDDQQEAVQEVTALFDQVHLPYILSSEIVRDQWNKLMVNCGLNQVCAAYDAPYGKIVSDPKLRGLFVAAMKEVQSVAAAYGIELTDAMIERWVKDTEAYDPMAMPSMRQDVRAGRQSEKQLFSGTVIPLARAKGIEVPVLEDLYEKVSTIDEASAQRKQRV